MSIEKRIERSKVEDIQLKKKRGPADHFPVKNIHMVNAEHWFVWDDKIFLKILVEMCLKCAKQSN